MFHRALPAALALCALAACQQPAPSADTAPDSAAPDAETVKAEVEADARQVVTDFNARDASKAAAHDGEGYVGLYSGTPNIVGAAADEQSMAEQMKDPSLKFELFGIPATTVSTGGDMAVFESPYSFTSTDPATKEPATESGNWVAIYRRQEGAMKLWRSILVAGPESPAPGDTTEPAA